MGVTLKAPEGARVAGDGKGAARLQLGTEDSPVSVVITPIGEALPTGAAREARLAELAREAGGGTAAKRTGAAYCSTTLGDDNSGIACAGTAADGVPLLARATGATAELTRLADAARLAEILASVRGMRPLAPDEQSRQPQ